LAEARSDWRQQPQASMVVKLEKLKLENVSRWKSYGIDAKSSNEKPILPQVEVPAPKRLSSPSRTASSFVPQNPPHPMNQGSPVGNRRNSSNGNVNRNSGNGGVSEKDRIAAALNGQASMVKSMQMQYGSKPPNLPPPSQYASQQQQQQPSYDDDAHLLVNAKLGTRR